MSIVEVRIVRASIWREDPTIQILTLTSNEPILEAGISQDSLRRKALLNGLPYTYFVNVPNATKEVDTGVARLRVEANYYAGLEYIGPGPIEHVIDEDQLRRLTDLENEVAILKEQLEDAQALLRALQATRVLP
jgi:hypothetical protein